MADNSTALTEGQELDAITGDEAKAILLQLGYFDPATLFTSFRFTEYEFQHLQEALAFRENLSPEALISALCEESVLDEKSAQEAREPS